MMRRRTEPLLLPLLLLVASAALSATSHSALAARTTSGLMALYDFTDGLTNQATTTAADSSGANLLGDLTLNLGQGVAWSASAAGLTFTGTGATDRCKSSGSTTALKPLWKSGGQGFTLEAWIKSATVNNGGTAASVLGFGAFGDTMHTTCPGRVNPSIEFLHNGVDKIAGLTKTTAQCEDWAMTLADTKVKHFVMTMSVGAQSQLLLYRDGALNGQKVMGAAFDADKVVNSSLRIAPQVITGGNPAAWSGTVYLVAVYNRSLTLDEIKDNFNAGVPNSPPSVPATRTVTAIEDDFTNITLTATDPDAGTNFTFKVESGPSHGQLYGYNGSVFSLLTAFPVTLATAVIRYKGDANFASVDEITYSVSDGTLTSASTGTLKINVTNSNDAPVASDLSSSAFAGVDTVLLLNGTDIDADDSLTLAYVQSLPSDGSLFWVASDGKTAATQIQSTDLPARINVTAAASNGLALVFRSAAQQASTNGQDVLYSRSFKFTVADKAGAQSANNGTMTVQVRNSLQSSNATQTAVEDSSSAAFSVPSSDKTNQTYNITITRLPTKGKLYVGNQTTTPLTTVPFTVSSSNNLFRYVPAADESGTLLDDFEYYVSRGSLQSAPAMLSFSVTAVDDPITVAILGESVLKTETNANPPLAVYFNITDPDAGTSELCANVFINEQVGATIALATTSNIVVASSSARRFQIRGTLTALQAALNPLSVTGTLKGVYTLRFGVYSTCPAVTAFMVERPIDVQTGSDPDDDTAIPTEYIYAGLAAFAIFLLCVCCTCCYCCKKYYKWRLTKEGKLGRIPRAMHGVVTQWVHATARQRMRRNMELSRIGPKTMGDTQRNRKKTRRTSTKNSQNRPRRQSTKRQKKRNSQHLHQ